MSTGNDVLLAWNEGFFSMVFPQMRGALFRLDVLALMVAAVFIVAETAASADGGNLLAYNRGFRGIVLPLVRDVVFHLAILALVVEVFFLTGMATVGADGDALLVLDEDSRSIVSPQMSGMVFGCSHDPPIDCTVDDKIIEVEFQLRGSHEWV